MALERILANIETFTSRSSSSYFERVNFVEVRTSNYTVFRGGAYLDLPEWIKVKKCCINVKNKDEKCFLYALESLRNPVKLNQFRVSNYDIHKYETIIQQYNIEFPLKTEDVKYFENGFSIDIYKLECEDVVLHEESSSKKLLHYNLLLLESEDKCHYVGIRKLHVLLKNKLENVDAWILFPPWSTPHFLFP